MTTISGRAGNPRAAGRRIRTRVARAVRVSQGRILPPEGPTGNTNGTGSRRRTIETTMPLSRGMVATVRREVTRRPSRMQAPVVLVQAAANPAASLEAINEQIARVEAHPMMIALQGALSHGVPEEAHVPMEVEESPLSPEQVPIASTIAESEGNVVVPAGSTEPGPSTPMDPPPAESTLVSADSIDVDVSDNVPTVELSPRRERRDFGPLCRVFGMTRSQIFEMQRAKQLPLQPIAGPLGFQHRNTTDIMASVPDGYSVGGSYTPPPVEPSPDAITVPRVSSLQDELRREAAKYQLDLEFYCYLVRKGFLTQRSVRRFTELKAKADTWLSANRAERGELWITDQFFRGLTMLQAPSAGDMWFVKALRSENLWDVDGRLSTTYMLHGLAKTGRLPTKGFFERWFTRTRRMPVD